MNEFSMKNRIFYYDMVRTFAIFSVIACHTFAFAVVKSDIFNTGFWYYAIILNTLRDIGVPLFVIISGSLLLNRCESLFKFTKKRIKRVLVPYLFWLIIFILFTTICNYIGYTSPVKFDSLLELLFKVISISPKEGAVFFWFVPMILVVYILIFITNYLKKYNTHVLKFSLIGSIITIILFNMDYLQLKEPLILYILYFIFAVIGYYLSNIDFIKFIKPLKINKNILTFIFLILFIIVYIIEIFVNSQMSINLNHYYCISQFSILNIIAVSNIFLFFRYFPETSGKLNRVYTHLSSNNIGKIIYSISSCSYGIYLSHQIIKFLLIKFLSIFNLNLPISSTITLILTLTVSWLFILLLSKIPYINIISGVV